MNRSIFFTTLYTTAVSAITILLIPIPANALTMKECSVKYQTAKEAGTLGGVSWADFRKNQCAENASTNTITPTNKPQPQPQPQKAAKALTTKQCGEKYQAAKEAGIDDGIKWNDFRKQECGPGADIVALSSDGKKEPPAPVIAAPQGVKFPSSVSSQFASETPGKARMHTCLEYYHNAKANNALGGLKWIQKGGGFYSLCNQRLKNNS